MTPSPDHLMLIDGDMCASASGDWLPSEDPANERPLGRVPLADAADVERAVSAAALAQPAWNARAVTERASLLRAVT